MPDNKKPRICEVLGVETNERFAIKDFGQKYYISSDGEFRSADYADDSNIIEKFFALMNIINYPDEAKRKSRWTPEDIEDAKAVRRLFPPADYVERRGDGRMMYVVVPGDLTFTVPLERFPSLQPGETVTIDEILEADHEI